MAEERVRAYRVVDRPGPWLALIEEPDGGVDRWTRAGNRRAGVRCANCGQSAARHYRPSLHRGPERPRLCVACVEGAPD